MRTWRRWPSSMAWRCSPPTATSPAFRISSGRTRWQPDLTAIDAVRPRTHIVADEGWGIPDSHRGAFDMLATRRLVASTLATELSAAASMRNRIAHGYASVDNQRLW